MDFGNIRSACVRMKDAWQSPTKPMWDGDAWFDIVTELSSMDQEVQRDMGFKYISDILLNTPRPVFMDAGLYNHGVGLYNAISSSLQDTDVLQMQESFGDEFYKMPILLGDHELVTPYAYKLYIPNDQGYLTIQHYLRGLFGDSRTLVVLPECSYVALNASQGHSVLVGSGHHTNYIVIGSNLRGSVLKTTSSNHRPSPNKLELRGHCIENSQLYDGVIDICAALYSCGAHELRQLSVINELIISNWHKPHINWPPRLPAYRNICFENVTFPNNQQRAFAHMLESAIETPAILRCSNYKKIVHACNRETRDRLVIID